MELDAFKDCVLRQLFNLYYCPCRTDLKKIEQHYYKGDSVEETAKSVKETRRCPSPRKNGGS